MAADRPGRVSERVHDRLRRDILEGRFAPGDAVPSERVLAEELAVNRHAVREALKRLEQAGLVSISQGGATRVRDWRDSGGLEVLLDLPSTDDGLPPADITRSVLEMRACIGVDAARRCATRASSDQRRAIQAFAEDVISVVDVDDATVDLRFAVLWQAIVAGSGNVAYRLALNSLVAAMAAYGEVVDQVRPRNRTALRALGTAIASGNADGAARAASELLEDDVFGPA
jgi:DNA-binding FadR family transcriptional regulator